MIVAQGGGASPSPGAPGQNPAANRYAQFRLQQAMQRGAFGQGAGAVRALEGAQADPAAWWRQFSAVNHGQVAAPGSQAPSAQAQGLVNPQNAPGGLGGPPQPQTTAARYQQAIQAAMGHVNANQLPFNLQRQGIGPGHIQALNELYNHLVAHQYGQQPSQLPFNAAAAPGAQY